MRVSFCIHQNNAKEWYDRIIRNYANLNNKKFLIPDNVCKLYSTTQDKMEFKTQCHNVVSKKIYSITKDFLLHEAGQGSGNAITE